MLANVEVFRESSIVHLRVPQALQEEQGPTWRFDFTWDVGHDWIAALVVTQLRRVFQAFADDHTQKHMETQERFYKAGWADAKAKRARMY